MRCVALALYGDQEKHGEVRARLASLARSRLRDRDLFALDTVYVLNENDRVEELTPERYVDERLSRDGNFSEHIDAHLVQKLLLEPLGAKLVVVNASESVHVEVFGDSKKLELTDFALVLLCSFNVHFDLVNAARVQGSSPRLVQWMRVPKPLRDGLVDRETVERAASIVNPMLSCKFR